MDRLIEKKRWTPQKIALILGIVAGLGLLTYFIGFADNSSRLNVESQKLTMATVSQGTFQEFIPVDGTVHPIKTIVIPAVEGGTVDQKFLEGGKPVQKGDPILKLTNNRLVLDFMNQETLMNDLINNLQNSKLTLQQNKFNLRRRLATLNAQVDAAKDVYDRNIALYESKAVSQQEFFGFKRDYERLKAERTIELESQKFEESNARTQIAQLETTIARTSRNLRMMEDNLKNLYIKAPISGQLSSIQVELGTPVQAGQVIGQIDDLSGFKVKAELDQHYVSRIFAGQRGNFTYNGQSYPLEISLVYSEVNNDRFPVDMKFIGKVPEGIRRGQTLQIRLQLSDPSPAVLLPRGGFYQSTGGAWAYVLDETGKVATKRSIRLGRQNPEYYEVLEGLKPGEQVITSSYDAFNDKDKLELKK
ncbi:efflux RND transporter periplasmic adaptor subunit [Rufibacter sp. LB8]|uniref:efflux RND transporter periplasmic adaptor subunit n=1 Tax=Rufibacter sp. LB8 TaxID=2777781 RepID=UPI00178C3575|nr:efflux RND transporter periplasmic adaptor subunit [Rufibacter sp. LB8]